jgi:hypothetical protein
MCLWFGAGLGMPAFFPTANGTWTAPSIGFANHDSMWRSAAWLFWAQAVFQMYPLPRAMGRPIVAALAAIFARPSQPQVQVTLFRRCLDAIALLTLLAAIGLMSLSERGSYWKWPLLMLLGLLLWRSSRARDGADFMEGFLSPPTAPPRDNQLTARQRVGHAPEHRGGVHTSLGQAIRVRRDRKRAKQALEQEHREAVDAKRLVEILMRLHRDGMESLDKADRQILDRVSERLRQRREVESTSDEASD